MSDQLPDLLLLDQSPTKASTIRKFFRLARLGHQRERDAKRAAGASQLKAREA